MISRTFELGRVTIELDAPATIGTGEGSDLVDSVCVVDANGLPVLPGTTIAGVLRHAFARATNGNDTGGGELTAEQRVFGDKGYPSRLWVSWGTTHDRTGRPVPMRGAARNGDPVLALLRAGVVRDHVRLDARGVVDTRGKFDVQLVPAGARFTFWLLLEHDDGDPGVELADLVALLAGPSTRFGAATRRGYGAFSVREVLHRSFDLAREDDWAAFEGLALDPGAPLPKGVLQPLDLQQAGAREGSEVRATIVLEPEDFFLFGSGEPIGTEHMHPDRSEKALDMIPYSEPRILWNARGEAQAIVDHEYVLPASSIKGPLRHRVAFHHRALRGRWVEGLENPSLEDLGPDRDEAVVELFGEIKDSRDEEPRGLRGRVLLTGARLARKAATLGVIDHVSLDRFTQGPMDGMLFSEGPIYARRGPDPVPIEVELTVVDPEAIPPLARQAFARALDDLVGGRLALGAGGNRGHGYFGGRVVWNERGTRWLAETEAEMHA